MFSFEKAKSIMKKSCGNFTYRIKKIEGIKGEEYLVNDAQIQIKSNFNEFGKKTMKELYDEWTKRLNQH